MPFQPPPPRRDLKLRQLSRATAVRPKPKATPPPNQARKLLTELPAELLAVIISWLPSPEDVGRVDCVAHAFHGAAAFSVSASTFAPSIVEEALRLRAASAGHTVPEQLPLREVSWTQKLCWDERRRRSRQDAAVACDVMHAAFVDAAGCLVTCGKDYGRRVLKEP